ncbi:recombinase family protein [Streptacidiphilus carbonis]|uniref:recombinase family protein n=1 Tax=Streptacidiphilus carbonis TaxID=105422 RepID=UPI0009FF5D58|nr:recombinase family protein [Streptacidiphilus carbonis]
MNPGTLTTALTSMVTDRHRDRIAVVYVRQSTRHQVVANTESTRSQYALVERAVSLGWARPRVLVIDEDLGRSGADTVNRPGFQRLVAEVSLDHVGLLLGIEVSRLARSERDWCQLLELCALWGVLLADADGVYDPADYNDRLLLGLKGTMSAAELHWIKQRMLTGRLNKARRGELELPLPLGYVRRPSGEVVLDPDERVREVVRLVFDKFDEIGAVHGVLRWLADHRWQSPYAPEAAWTRANWSGDGRTGRRCATSSTTPLTPASTSTAAAGRTRGARRPAATAAGTCNSPSRSGRR